MTFVEDAISVDTIDFDFPRMVESASFRALYDEWSILLVPPIPLQYRIIHAEDRLLLEIRRVFRVHEHRAHTVSTEIPILAPRSASGKSTQNARWWFLCPGRSSETGKACGKRCRVLYQPSPDVGFRCRRCHGLKYEASFRHRDRVYETVEKPGRQLRNRWNRRAPIRPDKDLVPALCALDETDKLIASYEVGSLEALSTRRLFRLLQRLWRLEIALDRSLFDPI